MADEINPPCWAGIGSFVLECWTTMCFCCDDYVVEVEGVGAERGQYDSVGGETTPALSSRGSIADSYGATEFSPDPYVTHPGTLKRTSDVVDNYYRTCFSQTGDLCRQNTEGYFEEDNFYFEEDNFIFI